MKTVLSKNLKALMSQRQDLDTLKKITAATDGLLSNGKLDRIRRAAAKTDIETVEQLAEVFGIRAWQLLRDDEALAAIPAPSLSAEQELTQAIQLVAAALGRTDKEDRPAVMSMLELLAKQPSRPGITAQQVALMLTGSTAQAPAAPDDHARSIPGLGVEIPDGEKKHGSGDRAATSKRAAGHG